MIMDGERIFLRILLTAAAVLLIFVSAQTLQVAENPADYSFNNMVKLWQERTEGENLAKGKKISYAPLPAYHLTKKNDTDDFDLTDGVIDSDSKQMIWFRDTAVGWTDHGAVKKIIIDLGEPACVGKVVWRVAAGSVNRAMTGPNMVRIFGSLDGERSRKILERRRHTEDSGRTDNYHLPNIGSPDTHQAVYVYPLEFFIPDLLTKYIIIEFTHDSPYLASDEIAVLQGNGKGKTMEYLPEALLQVADVWIELPDADVPVVTGVMLPTWFVQTDCRSKTSGSVTYQFDLPSGISLTIPSASGEHRALTGKASWSETKGGNKIFGPLFFHSDKSFTGTKEITYRAEGETAKPQPAQKIILRSAELLPVKLQKLTVSIGWLIEKNRLLWPGILDAYQHVGFNTYPTFPRGWDVIRNGSVDYETALKTSDPLSLLGDSGKHLRECRERGLKIVYMESPLHVVNWTYTNESDIKEYRCIDEKGESIQKINSFCPSYRGKFYRNEVTRLALQYVLMGGCDYAMWDCELLNSGRVSASDCARCQAAKEEEDQESDWDSYAVKKILEFFADVKKEINSAAKKKGWTPPPIGQYHVDFGHTYCGYDYSCGLYDFQNSSIYAGDNPEAIHQWVRTCRSRTKKNDIIPWLTTATYGYVSPVNTRLILWEAFCNGATGMTYYTLPDIQPSHYIEINKAFAAIMPLENIIVQGVPAFSEFTVNNKAVRISAVRLDKTAALLLVNTGSEAVSAEWQHRREKKSGTIQIPAADGVLLKVDL